MKIVGDPVTDGVGHGGIVKRSVPLTHIVKAESYMTQMRHGDELVIANGNSPAESVGKNTIVIRADGHSVPELLDAILQLMPLDQYTERLVGLMEVVPGDTCGTPVIWNRFREILGHREPNHSEIEMIERFAFYERAKNAYLIIVTGETAQYANVLLKKGVILS